MCVCVCTNTPEYMRSNYKIFYGFNLFNVKTQKLE